LLTFDSVNYTADRYGPDSIGYFGPDHNASILDDLQLSRVAPKPTSVFSGVSRTSAKWSRTVNLLDDFAVTPTAVLIMQVNSSIPVGMDSAELALYIARFKAYVALSSFNTLVADSKITY